jgi:hypothetical protein
MDAVAQLLSDLAAKLNVTIDVPHHTTKGAADPGNADRGRGASATINAARLAYTLSPMSEEEAKQFNISADDRRAYVRLDRAKRNVDRTTGAARWFKLVGVRLDNGNDTYPAATRCRPSSRGRRRAPGRASPTKPSTASSTTSVSGCGTGSGSRTRQRLPTSARPGGSFSVIVPTSPKPSAGPSFTLGGFRLACLENLHRPRATEGANGPVRGRRKTTRGMGPQEPRRCR